MKNSFNKAGNASNGIIRFDNLSSLTDGFRRVILEATDLAGNKANSTFINITIDTAPPVITISNPVEGNPYGYLISILADVADSESE